MSDKVCAATYPHDCCVAVSKYIDKGVGIVWLPNPRIHSSKLSEQLAQSLEQLILDGVYAVGERLPSERQMAEDYGVSRPSVAR